MIKLEKLFDEIIDDEYGEFERVENKLSSRPDIHAFILLNNLCPSDDDMISASEHDEFYLDVDLEKLEKIITREQVIDLVRCGVRYSEENDCLAMFS